MAVTDGSGRILVWYAIFTAVFRCPSSPNNLTHESPAVCKPYLDIRSQVQPYLQRFHNSYTAPYVDAARPYAEKFDKQVYSPTVTVGTKTYLRHGAPRVSQARHFGQVQWEKKLKPQIDAAQAQAKKQYEASLAPYVSKASEASVPYYSASRENIVNTFNFYVLPAYTVTRPYAQQSYAVGHKMITETGLPYARLAWDSAANFIDRTLWPQLRILYGENVEPQLVRIGERLGRYRDGRKLQAAVEDIDKTADSSSLSSVLSSASSAAASVKSAASSERSELDSSTQESSSSTLTPDEEAAALQEQINKDLKLWQENFSKAADKGTDDLHERVQEIIDRQVKSQVHGVGESLVVQLEESASSELRKLKRTIQKLAQSLSEDATVSDRKDANEELTKAVRGAGLTVKTKAQSLRKWKQHFESELFSLIHAASESTLEVIDNIRDLGLQEIGMRWAWMEGVTYKDWSRYHDMRKTFDEWRKEVKAVATEHESLAGANTAAEDIETKGMTIAEDTARELARLKELGKRKLEAGDASDDFSTSYSPPKVANDGRQAMDGASSIEKKIIDTAQGTIDSVVSEVNEQAADRTSQVSGVVFGSSTESHESASPSKGAKLSDASNVAFEAAHNAPQNVISIPNKLSSKANEAAQGSSSSDSESVVSTVSKNLGGRISGASEAIIDTPGPMHESFSSQVSEAIIGTTPPSHEYIASQGSEGIRGNSPPLHESVTSEMSKSAGLASSSLSKAADDSSTALLGNASKASSAAKSGASKASKKVFAGASAQKVKGQKPILDDVISDDDDSNYSEKMQNMISQAGDRYADITKAVSEALVKATSTQGTPAVTSIVSEQYASAFAAASSVLYGTEQGTVESVSSKASARYAEAVAA